MAAERVHTLIDAICGLPDPAAIRAVSVLNAHAAALAWVGRATGAYPAPAVVAARLREAAERLNDPDDSRDPDSVLIQVAATALAEERSSAA
jgi:hypothetical protein